MIKKKFEKSCALFMILLLTSTPGTETETILKDISSQLTEIEATEKKIENINNFLNEISKKEKEQKQAATEKLANVLNKKQNELLKEGLGKITKQQELTHQDIIKNFIQELKTNYKDNKEKTIEKLNNIVFRLDGSDNKEIDKSKKNLEKLILNLNAEKIEKNKESIIDGIITEFKNLIK